MAERYDVRNNEVDSRFEIALDGSTAVSEYHREGDRITFTHTEVPEALGGRGVANQLARGALDFARNNNLKVVPQCAFIAAFIKRNPEYADLVEKS